MGKPRGLYTPVYQSLPTNRKTMRAAAMLGKPRQLVVGHLVSLWTWGLGNVDREGGPLSMLEIAQAAEWPMRGAEKFVAALTEAGFIDHLPDGYYLHEWEMYGGKVVVELSWDRERKRPTSEEIPRNPDGIPSVDETRRDETETREKKKRSAREPNVVDEAFLAQMVEEFIGTFDLDRIRFELDKAENNKRVWDGWRDKRRGFRNWLKQAKEWQDKDAGTTRGGARTAGGQPNRGAPRAGGVAPNGYSPNAVDGFDVAPAGSVRAESGAAEGDPGAQPEGGYARRAAAGGGAW